MNRSPTILLGLALSLFAAAAHGQNTPTIKPGEHTSWYRIIYVKFKPGAAEEAQKLIYDHFWPIDKEIGREVIPFDPITGEWDQIVCFPMGGSPTQVALDDTALDKRWNEVLARREGGKAQADAINKRYMDLVANTKTEFALRRMP
jgi:hypothetical protein